MVADLTIDVNPQITLPPARTECGLARYSVRYAQLRESQNMDSQAPLTTQLENEGHSDIATVVLPRSRRFAGQSGNRYCFDLAGPKSLPAKPGVWIWYRQGQGVYFVGLAKNTLSADMTSCVAQHDARKAGCHVYFHLAADARKLAQTYADLLTALKPMWLHGER